MINLKNKKGGEKYLSLWWFFCLVIIGAGIIIAVSAFGVADIDVKEIEADILVSRVASCIVSNGFLKEGVLEGSFDVFEKCYIDKKIIDESGKYHLSFEVYDPKSCENIKGGSFRCNGVIESSIKSYGVKDFRVNQCLLDSKYFPKCSKKYIYVLDGKGEKYILHIIGGSNEQGRREI